jgi:hypothetical protein
MFPSDDVPMWRRDAPADTPQDRRDARTTRDRRDAHAPGDPERRVTELLSRLARSTQT